MQRRKEGQRILQCVVVVAAVAQTVESGSLGAALRQYSEVQDDDGIIAQIFDWLVNICSVLEGKMQRVTIGFQKELQCKVAKELTDKLIQTRLIFWRMQPHRIYPEGCMFFGHWLCPSLPSKTLAPLFRKTMAVAVLWYSSC